MSKIAEEYFKKYKPIFKVGALKVSDLPLNSIKEVAFIGRSNVGKSSLINAITNTNIAITSKTPGRTKQLNFFQTVFDLNLVLFLFYLHQIH